MSRRAEHLFSIIGQVDDAFIDEAACPAASPVPNASGRNGPPCAPPACSWPSGCGGSCPSGPLPMGTPMEQRPPPTRAAAAAPVLSTAALTVPHPARSLQAMPNLPAGKVRHRNRANCLS